MTVPFVATYRLQLDKDFTLQRAAELCEYLAELGISHVYLSPVLQARSDSTHGYDVVDPTRIDAARGGPTAWRRLLAQARRAGLGLVLDIVPNHMAASLENPWWRDVLEHGRASRHARFFDVDWNAGPLVLPILTEELDALLDAGAIRPRWRRGRFVLDVAGTELPLGPESVRDLLGGVRAAHATAAEGSEGADAATARESGRAAPPGVAAGLRAVAGDRARLRALLAAQAYRLCPWWQAARAINYRRFFDITDLVAVRVEDPDVFAATHALVLDLVGRGEIDGLRIDHVDGLRDPRGYLERLRARAGDVPIWVEKILHPGERLRSEWPVAGTTGYEFIRLVDGLLVDPDGAEPLARFQVEFTGETRSFERLARDARFEALDTLFVVELDRLARRFAALVGEQRAASLAQCRAVLRAFLAALGPYRTYLRHGEPLHPDDRRWIEAACSAVVEQGPEQAPEVHAHLVEALRDILLRADPAPEERELALRLQQLSPALAAKGIEDTALYRDTRLLALNEVGGDPAGFGVDPAAFHEAMQETQAQWPQTLLTTSTHDTKRGADVRARLAVLSEMPERWIETVRRWSERAARLQPALPDRHAEAVLFQTLVGAWPVELERLHGALQKSVREAGVRTSWLQPQAAYEEALQAATERLLADSEFRAEVDAFVAELARPARSNSLAMLLLLLTAPGIPDVYQGSELLHLRLVDPDNRAPVDFARRARLLHLAVNLTAAEALAAPEPGLAKLWLLHRVLAVRRAHARAFGAEGDYEPLFARGARRAHVVAFARGGEVVTVVPRLVLRWGGAWDDTVLPLPAGSWRDALTGAEHTGAAPLSGLLGRFAVALLVRAGTGSPSRGSQST